jgi:hypothetical protein
MKTSKSKKKVVESINVEEGQLSPGGEEKEGESSSQVVKPRRRNRNLSYVKTVFQVRMAIESSLEDPEIMGKVLRYGYDEAELRVGLGMVDELELLNRLQGNMWAEKKGASRKKAEIGKEVEKKLSRLVQTARLAFADEPEILVQMRSPGKRRRDFSVWLEKGKIFYHNALNVPGALEGFGRLGVTQEELEAGRQKLLEVETQSAVQFGLNADRQVARDHKAIVYDRLREWWGEYRKISRIALKSTPQLLEKFGITIPSRKNGQYSIFSK